MPIRILPPILANQIAAGEVVERPASVVKELVENSLDAGADRIEIELEKGGCKLIRIRDNGAGIPRDELALALSRHATSKVWTIDDLESIGSLGFRGEALASISSVSRLTLTSRPASQSEAWQASAEGREMAVELRPAAHPAGTTLDVVDLFFNTPARRKFLRSEKTEFSHIDELLRRLALSRFDVSFTLKHNGKLVRQYRAAHSPEERQRRVALACGAPFLSRAISLSSAHLGLTLSGWLLPPAESTDTTPEIQYCYVNGRMMRDKLINHAIRQGYLEALGVECSPSYVLYLTLDPRQVDVNVHPAKHEVRFHESRLVHDFIVRVVCDALNERFCATHQAPEIHEPPLETAYPQLHHASAEARREPALSSRPHGYLDRHSAQGSQRGRGGELSAAAWQGVQGLLTTLPAASSVQAVEEVSASLAVDSANQIAAWRVLSLPHPKVALLQCGSAYRLLHLPGAEAALLGHRLRVQWTNGAVTTQPLLMPILIQLESSQRQQLMSADSWLGHLGIEWKAASGDNIMIYRVPVAMRNSNLAKTFLELLALGVSSGEADCAARICDWLAGLAVAQSDYSLPSATALVANLLDEQPERLLDESLSRAVGFSSAIEELLREA
ncbi:MAG: DNA mismatch repair endonuclease MutL [Aeromonadaceae bacterium]